MKTKAKTLKKIFGSPVKASRKPKNLCRPQSKSCDAPATKADLEKMERRLGMKLSELKPEVGALKAQITKVSEEQQKRFDALSAKIKELEDAVTNNDPELPADVTEGFTEVKSLLQQLDDTIIDTAPPA